MEFLAYVLVYFLGVGTAEVLKEDPSCLDLLSRKAVQLQQSGCSVVDARSSTIGAAMVYICGQTPALYVVATDEVARSLREREKFRVGASCRMPDDSEARVYERDLPVELPEAGGEASFRI